ncbi:fatty acid hydroxylase [bacterium]|nr:MAG: fatty acid hydroxylase [bacterium]
MGKKNFISNKDESVRMFKWSFMEALSKTHWSAPIFVFVPIISYFAYLGFSQEMSVIYSLLMFLTGVFVWTFAEYALHRFVFHYEPKSNWGKQLHWMMHGVHHDYPQDAKRLVLPPGLSLLFSTILYLFFYLFIPIPTLYNFFAGFLLGYLVYDISHYALHHFSFKSNLFKKIKLHHMKHHYVDPNVGYGVSTPLWDYIFRTREKAKK